MFSRLCPCTYQQKYHRGCFSVLNIFSRGTSTSSFIPPCMQVETNKAVSYNRIWRIQMLLIMPSRSLPSGLCSKKRQSEKIKKTPWNQFPFPVTPFSFVLLTSINPTIVKHTKRHWSSRIHAIIIMFRGECLCSRHQNNETARRERLGTCSTSPLRHKRRT